MELREVILPVPKDFAEVVDLIDGIIEKVQAKAEIADYMDLIDELTAAADGVMNVKEAVQGVHRDECAAYLVKVLMERLAPGDAPE